jgi:hypothetical protein
MSVAFAKNNNEYQAIATAGMPASGANAMAPFVPSDPETLLTRVPVADALTATGYPTSPKTLATMASRGGGPPYRKFGNRAVYRWGDALQWAIARLGPIMTSTSKRDAA